jgi:predicted  nucleic acid-binding Zn-ribbon protein
MKAKEAKLKAKEAKLKAKEDKMKAKEDKIKAKEDKIKAKEDKIKTTSLTNTSSNDVLEDKTEEQLSLGCSAIIKTGSRKGSLCGFKIFENSMCKRHHVKIIV